MPRIPLEDQAQAGLVRPTTTKNLATPLTVEALLVTTL